MPRARLLLVALALAAMAAYCVARFRLTTDILQFLDSAEDVQVARLARRVADSDLTRTIVLSVEAPDADAAVRASAQLGQKLRGVEGVAWVRTGLGDAEGEAIYDLYFPRRLGFLTAGDDEQRRELLSDEGLRRAARALKADLASPVGVVEKRLAGSDPLRLFSAQLHRFEAARAGPLAVRDGQLIAEDQRHGIVFLASRAAAFDAEAQRAVAAAIARAFAEVQATEAAPLRLEQSGLARYAIAAEAGIVRDINRISVLSTVGIAVVFLALFRSLRPLLLALLSLAIGMVTATFATLVVFGKLHGLTWAFGSSLLGVCIDYPLHLFNHHAHVSGERSPAASARQIWPGLVLGALTTLAGFAGLGGTSFPGLREFALFASVGILAALFATRDVLPPLMDGLRPAGAGARAVARWLVAIVQRLTQRPRLAWGLLLGALAVCAAGASRVRFDDRVEALNVVDPAVQAEDERVRARVSRMDTGKMIVALGRDSEEALGRNDALWGRLQAARRRGVLGDLRSLHDLVWSADTQRRNLAALAASPQLPERLAAAFAAEGFRRSAFAPFAEALASPPPPLTLAEVLASPLGDVARSFVVEADGEVGVLTFVRDVPDDAALAQAVSGVPGVHVINQSALVSKTYGRYRRRVIELIGLGLLVVWGLVFANYRSVGRTAAACGPALLASLTTLSLLTLLGQSLNLLHIAATLLVLSMGVDYGIFLVESGDDEEHLAATMMSILAGCLLTALGFGLLAMSSNPALRAIGLTTGIGNTLSLLLAPTGRLLDRRAR